MAKSSMEWGILILYSVAELHTFPHIRKKTNLYETCHRAIVPFYIFQLYSFV